jgi:ABC-2 type transport system ATP-binding protein
MADVILKIDRLVKHFRSHWTFRPIKAVKGVSVEVNRGESFGFLGPNGAGKTTTIKCILGLIHKTGGHIYFNGEELRSSKQRESIGYLPEQPYFYDHLTVRETLEFFASLHDMKGRERRERIDELLEIVKLADRADASIRSLSKGLQQRLGFAQAIVNRPELLLLDEPFSGLDPLGRLELRRLVLDLKKNGVAIFLSSHILSDVENICDRVSIMAEGEIKTAFYLRESSRIFGESFELSIVGSDDRQDFIGRLRRIAMEHSCEDNAAGSYHSFRFNDYATAQAALGEANQSGARIADFRSRSLSLEDIFMKITTADETQPNGPQPREQP